MTTTSPSSPADKAPEMRQVRPSRRPAPNATAAKDAKGAVRVGVYIRVSTAREEMVSPELQRRDVNAYIERMQGQQKWIVVRDVEDLDISGRSFARAGIKELMTLLREGAISKILTYRYDRFGRNVEQALAHVNEVESLGGQVVSVTEPFDATTSMGSFMRTQSFALAEMYSKQIGEGWMRVHQHRVDSGLPGSGQQRFGYLSHRTGHQRGDGTIKLCPQGCPLGECKTGYVPDPETADVVRRIYACYLGGMGFQAIAQELNQRGLLTPGQVRARRSGNPDRIAKMATTRWGAGTVIDLADSGFSAGLLTHRGEWLPGVHEPLIDGLTWQAYRKRREAQRIVPTKARSAKWSLAGVAVCGGCGGPMYCTSSPRGEQYAMYCGAARDGIVCSGTYRTRAAVEAAFGLWLNQYAQELERLTREALKVMPVQHHDPTEAERRRLVKTISGSDAKLSRLLDAYTDGVLDLAEYKNRRDTLQVEATAAQGRLAELDGAATEAPTPKVVASFAELWPTLDPEARRDVAKALVTSVRVMPDKSVEITPRWSLPVAVTFTHRGRTPQIADQLRALSSQR
jgi:site-specific DNA recombinase